jgi:hypothetical protein
VDASKPEEYGGYYAWGEVETKTDYSWETYKWCNGTANTLTKYCNNSEYGYNGYTDDKYVLDPEDDVAHVKWGGDWRMPTREELKELTEACSWTREIRDSIDGVKITGPNGNSIFIPAAGYYSGTEWIDSELHNNDSRDLDIWTSTPGDNYKSYFLWLLTSSYLSKGVGTYDRYRGWSVRPVCPSEEWLAHITISLDHETIMLKMDQELRLGADVYYDNESYWPAPIRWTSDNPSVATVNQDGMITAKGIGICTVSAYVGTVQSSCTVIVTDPEQATDYENGYAFVDLGLSVKWATYNVGATSPKEFGDYFAWGETDYYYEDGQNTSAMPDWKTGKSSGYDWASYKWCMGTEETLTKYNMDSSLGTVDDKIQLDLEDDVANIKWGGKWRLPSHDELCELCDSDNCIWIWSSLTNEYSFKVNGYLVISKKTGYEGVSIFLPAIGFRYNTAIGSTRSYSYYWSSSVNSSNPLSAWSISFSRNYYDVSCNDRYYGLSVRPVCP